MKFFYKIELCWRPSERSALPGPPDAHACFAIYLSLSQIHAAKPSQIRRQLVAINNSIGKQSVFDQI